MTATCETLNNQTERTDAIQGCLLGMAVGDALGVPREGLSARRAEKLFGTGELEHRLVFRRGMISDDTEHTCMTAQALLTASDDSERFQRSLASRLRWWLLGAPAGIGFGTLRAILKLWVGVPASRSGVRSAGNGPAMRAPIIGVLLAHRKDFLEAIVQASTELTHEDRRAEQGALAIASAAAYAATHRNQEIQWCEGLRSVRERVTEPELLQLLELVASHLERGSLPEELATDMRLTDGVTGYIYHTVPIALFCWLRYLNDFRESVTQAIRLGGDTDTVAGITGTLAGTTAGRSGIPENWIDGLLEWPRSVDWMDELGIRLARQFPDGGIAEDAAPLALFWPGQLLRNLAFATIVVGHGVRRLMPPY